MKPTGTIDERDKNTPDDWIPRHPELIRLTGLHPFNSEPPLPLLVQDGPITSNAIHYVRNHGAVPELVWENHTLEFQTGKISKTFTMDQLVAMPSRTLPVLLVCAGNRRKEQNMVKQSLGFSWGPSALSTANWTGVSLWYFLEQLGVELTPEDTFVCFEGTEDLPKGKYGTSLPLYTALDRSCDVLLAYKMNGEYLPPDHGFPLRVIIPGHIGGRMVKWLKKISIQSTESSNYYHYHDNRVLPTPVESAEAANAGGWWFKPEYIIMELNVNSAISSPAHGQELSITGSHEFQGYAYAGGGRKVIRVELTVDGGKTWQLCKINRPRELPMTEYGKHFCWIFWSLSVELSSSISKVSVRAWDSAMTVQPENLTWNIMGMMNNPWFTIHLVKIESDDRVIIEQPTQPGNLSGGWMTKAKSNEDFKEEEDEIPNDQKVFFTMDQVAKHTAEDDCWIVIRNKVYDCTEFVQKHPGGTSSILLNAGQDCSQDFEAIHSKAAWKLLRNYYIGELETRSSDCTKKIQNSELGVFHSLEIYISIGCISRWLSSRSAFHVGKEWYQTSVHTCRRLELWIRLDVSHSSLS